MASATLNKVLCVVCNKGKGSFKCEGCSQIFCPKHSIDHRNELSKQLEDIEVEHDLVKQTLNQQTEDPRQHPLLKKIDQWEQNAIVKIRQTAGEAREKLLENTMKHTNNIKEKLKHLSDDLRQGRDDGDFIETDLQQWTQKLKQLKKELLSPTTIAIQEDSTALITKIRIGHQDASDRFQRVCGGAQIEQNGQLIVKNGIHGHTEIRGERGYNTGKHTIRFRVEQLFRNGWIFFGIISKSESMTERSYNSPSAYGWSNISQVYIGGNDASGQTMQIVHNDAITLSIDCDQRKIELRNERLNNTIQMVIDTNKCKFPWQLHLNLTAANTHVRLLNSSN